MEQLLGGQPKISNKDSIHSLFLFLFLDILFVAFFFFFFTTGMKIPALF